jgi:hypothetical protein
MVMFCAMMLVRSIVRKTMYLVKKATIVAVGEFWY